MFFWDFMKEKKSDISLHYFSKGHNLGDVLNVPIVEDLFHIKVVEGGIDTADLMAVGSLLDRLIWGSVLSGSKSIRLMQERADINRKIHVWGTGLMYLYTDFSEMRFIRPVKIHALRGELTRKAIEDMIGGEVVCPTGDPGLLAPYMLSELPEKKYSLGIIPHYVEYGMDEFRAIQRKVPNSIIIDVTGDISEVLSKIAACDAVISTSLHGLIVADAFGVPNKWCKLTDRILGNGFKYRDYYSGFNVEEEAFDLNNGRYPDIYTIVNNYQINQNKVKEKQKRLIKSFPFRSGDVKK